MCCQLVKYRKNRYAVFKTVSFSFCAIFKRSDLNLFITVNLCNFGSKTSLKVFLQLQQRPVYLKL